MLRSHSLNFLLVILLMVFARPSDALNRCDLTLLENPQPEKDLRPHSKKSTELAEKILSVHREMSGELRHLELTESFLNAIIDQNLSQKLRQTQASGINTLRDFLVGDRTIPTAEFATITPRVFKRFNEAIVSSLHAGELSPLPAHWPEVTDHLKTLGGTLRRYRDQLVRENLEYLFGWAGPGRMRGTLAGRTRADRLQDLSLAMLKVADIWDPQSGAFRGLLNQIFYRKEVSWLRSARAQPVPAIFDVAVEVEDPSTRLIAEESRIWALALMDTLRNDKERHYKAYNARGGDPERFTQILGKYLGIFPRSAPFVLDALTYGSLGKEYGVSGERIRLIVQRGLGDLQRILSL